MLPRTAAGYGRGLVLSILAVGNAVLLGLTAVVFLLCFGIGLIFLFPPLVRAVRGRTRQARRLSAAWSGVEIAAPYRQAPPPPMPQRDGWYRDGRQLYRTSMIPAFNRTWNWMIKDPATWRDFAWLTTEPLVGGLLAATPLAMLGYGLVLVGGWQPMGVLTGLVLIALSVYLAPRVIRVHGLWTRLLLAPTARAGLTNAMRHLTQVHTEAVDSQAAELRRIERDLHDGAQARLVAIGMTLGAAEELMDSDPNAAKALLAKVREASAASLVELRQLVRGIHPPVLAERGLGDAVRAMALDSPLKVTVSVDLPSRPDAPVESAAYFVISELLANASRHSDARTVSVDISHRRSAMRVTVVDDGHGGADPSRGSGLRGIERRLAAFDGVLALNSPPGGPTLATVDLPRAFLVEGCGGSDLPTWRLRLMGVCWGLFWLPLFPQGLVAMFFKIFNSPERSWFLALYLPPILQWPTIIGMIALGVVMVVFAAKSAALAKEKDSEPIT
ncbi:sensor histidine kinase [Sphaerisporangium corydalis]|uniref:histidine kinase n=1 Tax=Sphaerisporangium corydalis TaxID=1441875 RepID=A0ABV9EG12_9ACTN|nr:histidine kinase [Sphaerisporangium corydalis]